jgi:autophagy-related protein 18
MAVARAAGGMGSFLNSHWEPSRDFAYLKLPSAGVSSVVAVSSTTPQVLVATSEGFFYSYNIDLESGGECTLTRREWSVRSATGARLTRTPAEFSLLEGEDSSNGAASTMD